MKREVIDVRVSKQILWVGGEAYPLQNIARAQAVKIVPRRGAAFWSWLGSVVVWVCLGVAASFVLMSADLPSSTSETLGRLAVGGMSLLIVISTVKLLAALLQRTLYALVIETAGTPFRAVATTDGSLIRHLVERIMAAINDPRIHFDQKVENHYGDKITQFGSHSVGKEMR